MNKITSVMLLPTIISTVSLPIDINKYRYKAHYKIDLDIHDVNDDIFLDEEEDNKNNACEDPFSKMLNLMDKYTYYKQLLDNSDDNNDKLLQQIYNDDKNPDFDNFLDYFFYSKRFS